jgi:hypothetical protein
MTMTALERALTEANVHPGPRADSAGSDARRLSTRLTPERLVTEAEHVGST